MSRRIAAAYGGLILRRLAFSDWIRSAWPNLLRTPEFAK